MEVSPYRLYYVKEHLRRVVRQVFACWILPIVPIMLYLEGRRVSEEHAAYVAIWLSAIFCVPLWLLYRLIRFALNR